jgi:hypothetical protein
MTEAEWLAFETLYAGEHIPGVHELLTERKCRLFASAFARRIWQYIPEGQPRQILETLEEMTDRGITQDELDEIQDTYEGPENPSGVEGYARSVVVTCMWDQGFRLFSTAASYCRATIRTDSPVKKARRREQEEERAQCELLRDILPNPFRKLPKPKKGWLTETVVALAAGVYAERAFDRMPILADALEDAGCDHADILAHCRGDGPHVRGCWVIDLLLGKS